jgi:DNA-binding transcriptional regulator YiaG
LTPADVRAARKTLGLTQDELADVIGKALRAIKYWEDDNAPERQRIPIDAALLLHYMVHYGLPDVALKGRRK